jgi:hypothetical protein
MRVAINSAVTARPALKEIPRREVAANVSAGQYISKSKSNGSERVRTYPPEHQIHSLWLPRSWLLIRIFAILVDHVKNVEGFAAVLGVPIGKTDLWRPMRDFRKQI